MIGLRSVLAAAAALLFAAPAPAVATSPNPQAQPGRNRLTLVAQTPYVGTGADFSLRVRVERANQPAPADVLVTIFRPVQTRSEFEQTLADKIGRAPAAAPVPFPLSTLSLDGAGEGNLRVPADLGVDDGVFPVRVDLRDRVGGSLDHFVTHLVYLTGSHSGPKLGLALVLPVQAGLSLPPDGPRQVPGLDEEVAALGALDAARALPFALAPSAETLAALAAGNDDKVTRGLDALRRVAADHPVLSSPYVPVSLPALLDAGLQDEVGNQLNRAASVVTDVLRVRPDARTWVATEPLDPESVDELVRRGVERMVAADPVLDPVADLSLTLSRPFVLAGREEDLPAVVADAGLATHFVGANPVLQAHHLLADLAVLWLDAPAADRRAVVAMAPPEWQATRAFLDTLAAGLAQSPVAEAVTLDTVFTAITPAVTARGTTLVRHPSIVVAGGLGEVVPELRQARRRLTSLATVLPAPTPGSTLLEERLLVAESSALRGSRARQAYVNAVEAGIEDDVKAIEMPSNRSITLTARRAQIPVTFQNRTGSPARVVVTVQSDKLEFPDGTSRPLELARRNTTERFSVVARTSGAFPLRITLQSPDGNLTIGRTRLTVRSTAASRVSLVVSLSAALFLAVWWGRHIVRGRRARTLVPA